VQSQRTPFHGGRPSSTRKPRRQKGSPSTSLTLKRTRFHIATLHAPNGPFVSFHTRTTGLISTEFSHAEAEKPTSVQNDRHFDPQNLLTPPTHQLVWMPVVELRRDRTLRQNLAAEPSDRNSGVPLMYRTLTTHLPRFRGSFVGLVALAVAHFAAPATMHAADANLARLGIASQSSTDFEGVASRANDGNISAGGYFYDATTSHTAEGVNNFWQVDLGGSYDLSRVDLFARSDCCDGRLSNFFLRVLDAPGGNVVHEQLVANDIAPNTIGTFALPAGTTGQVVQVQFNGVSNANTGLLSLREARVFGDYPVVPGSNLAALFGVVSQSSTAFGGFASRVIDGNTDGIYGNNSVSHSDGQANPSLTIDLGSEFFVDDVVLWNRTDFFPEFDCCLGRTRDITIELLGADGTTVVATSPLLNPGNAAFGGTGAAGPETLGFDFGHATGQYVRVTLNSPSAFLHLAEVEVFGAAVPEPSSLALAGFAVVALVGYRVRVARRQGV
jgi:hypothetical protein